MRDAMRRGTLEVDALDPHAALSACVSRDDPVPSLMNLAAPVQPAACNKVVDALSDYLVGVNY